MNKNTRNRIITISIAIVFTLLFIRVFWLQIIFGEKYKRLSIENCVRQVLIRAPRGLIYDCNKRVLADTRPGYTIYVPKDKKITYLEDSLQLQFKETEESKFIRDVPFQIVCMIEERRSNISDISIVTEPLRRTYFADSICHFIGYMGEISKSELNIYKGYRAGDIIGKTGIEKQYDKYLKGKDGVNYIEVDAKGREIGIFSPGKQPIPGNNIFLSIDIELQRVCIKAMAGHTSGVIVAINPQDGRILAYYSQPGFNPNHFSPYIKEDRWIALSRDTIFPLFDRVKNGKYPPGSVFKLFITAAGIENGLLTENTLMPITCKGGIQIGNRYFRCWDEHGQLELISAIIQSCDVYFYQIGMQLGVDNIANYSRIFKLGEKTGIDLPGESGGLIPDERWFNSHYGKRGWSQGNVANLAIGQGEILLTPLNMASFISTIANGGTIYTPTLTDSIVSYEGKIIFRNSKQAEKVSLNDETIAFIRKAMLGVVQHADGTGRAANINDIMVAGKTGTAQNPQGEDHAWFVCFAPFDKPTIALIVFIEHGGMGGGVAAPIAGEILRYYFREQLL